MMQEETVVTKIKKSYRFVDIIFGTHNIFKLAELISERMDEKKMVVDIWKGTDRIVEELPPTGSTRSSPALILCLAAIISAATVSFLTCAAAREAGIHRISWERSDASSQTVWWRSCSWDRMSTPMERIWKSR